MRFSVEQQQRLNSLGADSSLLAAAYPDAVARNAAFQKHEARLVQGQHAALMALSEGERRPLALCLEQAVAATLRQQGFLQVHTPIIMSRSRLEKMGITADSLMGHQVFWLDSNRCLRPMLAPHLYEYMVEMGRLLPRPLRLFEVGPCFRRETQGARHANEFTMLNLVEMGLPEGTDMEQRLLEVGALVLEAAGVKEWSLCTEESTVYGTTADFVDATSMELGSSAIGPLPMDAAWGVTENWIGVGFGIERLCMATTGEAALAKFGRSLTSINGIRFRL